MRLYEISNVPLSLPPTPDDSIRYTHVTSLNIAKALNGGQSFKYNGQLNTTTDSFKNEQQLQNFITTRKYGAYNRTQFGNVVVIMDISNQENRMHCSFKLSPGYVDNSRILGYVVSDTNQFFKNSNYNPRKAVNYSTRTAAQFNPENRFKDTQQTVIQSTTSTEVF